MGGSRDWPWAALEGKDGIAVGLKEKGRKGLSFTGGKRRNNHTYSRKKER